MVSKRHKIECVITITSKNQVTIPVSIVRDLGLSPRRKLVAVFDGTRIILTPKKSLTEALKPIHAKVAAIRGDKPPLSDEDMQAFLRGGTRQNIV